MSTKHIMIKKTWKEFMEIKLLWWLNRSLHLFGWAIVIEQQEDGTVTDAYPARVDWRGFSPEAEAEGFEGLGKWIADEAAEEQQEPIMRKQDSAIIPTTVPVAFNINDYVMVKLTPHGRAIHEAQHRELMGDIPVTSGWEYLPPREDEDGWSKWQAWHLMSTFGQHVFLGCEAPFETEIRIVLPASILNTPL